jgi:hypothetical protein
MDRIKTLQIKIKGGNLSIKSIRHMRTQVDTTQPKEKTKANNQQKSSKDRMQRAVKATK